MNKGLIESAENYDAISDRGIHPICKEDTKIISKLTGILIGMDANPDLIDALKGWKNIPDQDVLGSLEELELELEQDVDGAMKKTIDFIDYEGTDLTIKSLFSIKRCSEYSEAKRSVIFKVIINENDDLKVINGNIEVSFDSEEERNSSYEAFKEQLSEFTNIRFL